MIYGNLIITVSGIHIIFVVGYGCSNVLRAVNSDDSSSNATICTFRVTKVKIFSFF